MTENLLDLIKIEEYADGTGKFHTAESGYKNGNPYEYVVSMEKEYACNSWEAHDVAVKAGLLDHEYDDSNDIPQDVFVWRIEDPHNTEYYASESDAQREFERMIDLYYDAEVTSLDENLSAGSSYVKATYDQDFSWMTEGMDTEDREAFNEEGVKAHAITWLTVNKDFSNAVAEWVWNRFTERFPRSVTAIAENARR